MEVKPTTEAVGARPDRGAAGEGEEDQADHDGRRDGAEDDRQPVADRGQG